MNNPQAEITAEPIALCAEDEVRHALRKMKVGKAVGPNEVPVEAWKALRDRMAHPFPETVTVGREDAGCLYTSTSVPIFKQKGYAMAYSNYRGIKLSAHTVKLYERLVDRLRELVPISQEQFGFMPERSTTDVIFIARQLTEKYR